MIDYISVRLDNLDYGIHALSRCNEDGGYTIVLNARDSFNRQQDAYLHELNHIKRNDFEKTDIQDIEFVTHQV